MNQIHSASGVRIIHLFTNFTRRVVGLEDRAEINNDFISKLKDVFKNGVTAVEYALLKIENDLNGNVTIEDEPLNRAVSAICATAEHNLLRKVKILLCKASQDICCQKDTNLEASRGGILKTTRLNILEKAHRTIVLRTVSSILTLAIDCIHRAGLNAIRAATRFSLGKLSKDTIHAVARTTLSKPSTDLTRNTYIDIFAFAEAASDAVLKATTPTTLALYQSKGEHVIVNLIGFHRMFYTPF